MVSLTSRLALHTHLLHSPLYILGCGYDWDLWYSFLLLFKMIDNKFLSCSLRNQSLETQKINVELSTCIVFASKMTHSLLNMYRCKGSLAACRPADSSCTLGWEAHSEQLMYRYIAGCDVLHMHKRTGSFSNSPAQHRLAFYISRHLFLELQKARRWPLACNEHNNLLFQDSLLKGMGVVLKRWVSSDTPFLMHMLKMDDCKK